MSLGRIFISGYEYLLGTRAKIEWARTGKEEEMVMQLEWKREAQKEKRWRGEGCVMRMGKRLIRYMNYGGTIGVEQSVLLKASLRVGEPVRGPERPP